MSTSVYYRQPIPDPDGEFLGYQIKFALKGRYFEHDGSLITNWFTLSNADITFLEGVKAAGNSEVQEESQKLIGLIEKFGSVEIRLR